MTLTESLFNAELAELGHIPDPGAGITSAAFGVPRGHPRNVPTGTERRPDELKVDGISLT